MQISSMSALLLFIRLLNERVRSVLVDRMSQPAPLPLPKGLKAETIADLFGAIDELLVGELDDNAVEQLCQYGLYLYRNFGDFNPTTSQITTKMDAMQIYLSQLIEDRTDALKEMLAAVRADTSSIFRTANDDLDEVRAVRRDIAVVQHTSSDVLTRVTSLGDLSKSVADVKDGNTMLMSVLDVLQRSVGTADRLTEIIVKASETITSTQSAYQQWLANLTSTVNVLEAHTKSSITVSSDVVSIVNAASKVAADLQVLTDATNGFQLWLSGEMSKVEAATTAINGMSDALVKNLEVVRAQDAEAVKRADRYLEIAERKSTLDLVDTIVDAVTPALALGRAINPPREVVSR